MQTLIMLTRLISEEVNPSFTIQRKESPVVEKIQKCYPDVEWVGDYAIAGPWDYLDIFRAPDLGTAMKVSGLVRYYGGAHTEIWAAKEWKDFKDTLRELSEIMETD